LVISKNNSIKLIDAYIQDDDVISAKPKEYPTYFPGFKFDIEYFRLFKEGVFILNSKETKKQIPMIEAYHNDEFLERIGTSYLSIYKEDGYKVKFPDYKEESFTYYNALFSFENDPSIEIYSHSKQSFKEEKGEGQKEGSIWGYNKVELNFKIWEVTKPIHYLKCGTFEFKLTDLEVDAIYNKIVDRRLEVKKAFELVEMNKRFDKYGIV